MLPKTSKGGRSHPAKNIKDAKSLAKMLGWNWCEATSRWNFLCPSHTPSFKWALKTRSVTMRKMEQLIFARWSIASLANIHTFWEDTLTKRGVWSSISITAAIPWRHFTHIIWRWPLKTHDFPKLKHFSTSLDGNFDLLQSGSMECWLYWTRKELLNFTKLFEFLEPEYLQGFQKQELCWRHAFGIFFNFESFWFQSHRIMQLEKVRVRPKEYLSAMQFSWLRYDIVCNKICCLVHTNVAFCAV